MAGNEALEKIAEIKRRLSVYVDRDEMEWTDDPVEALNEFVKELTTYTGSLHKEDASEE